MWEREGNIWDFLGMAVVAITTNGHVNKNGRVLMGRGVARQAVRLFPDIPETLARLLILSGNHVHCLGHNIVSFPVEYSPYQVPDMKLIERSAHELLALTEEQGWQKVVVPRPGCGGGGLLWREVRPLLADVFDDRFLVISAPSLPSGK